MPRACDSCGSRDIVHESNCRRPGVLKRHEKTNSKPHIKLHYSPLGYSGGDWYADLYFSRTGDNDFVGGTVRVSNPGLALQLVRQQLFPHI
jgi:hypothetical protein